MAEHMRRTVANLMRGIDRYNPENLGTLERYVELQSRENAYDLEANLAVLKLYQFNPMYFQLNVAAQILLKALTNLPHTDFVLCKCLIDEMHQQEEQLSKIIYLYDLLETCQFKKFWSEISLTPDIVAGIVGFGESIRKYICHVVGITYQHIDVAVFSELLGDVSDEEASMWMTKYGWTAVNDKIFIANQEENVKPKNITEKIDFENVAGILATASQ